MAFPTDTFLQFFRNSGEWIAQEFEHLYAQIEGYLNVEHKSDGSHGNIHGDSLTLTANGTTGATGNISADGSGTFGGNVVADNGSTNHCELGLQSLIASEALESGLLIGGKSKGFFFHAKVETSPGLGTGKELRIWNLNNTSVSVLRLVYDNSNSRWLFGIESGGALAIGEDSSGKRIAELNALTVRANSGYLERGRSVTLGTYTDVAYASGNFSQDTGTWTVDAGDQSVFRVAYFGATARVQIALRSTSVASSPTALKVTLPFTSTAKVDTVARCINGALVQDDTYVSVPASSNVLSFTRASGAAWPNSTNQTFIWAEFDCPI